MRARRTGTVGTVEWRTYSDGTTDFNDSIAAYKAAEPKLEAIYSARLPGSAVTLIKHIRDAGIDVPLPSADGRADKDIVDASK